MKPLGYKNEMEAITGAEDFEEIPHYVRNMWTNWKIKYETEYSIAEEDEVKLRTFYNNVKIITEHANKPD